MLVPDEHYLLRVGPSIPVVRGSQCCLSGVPEDFSTRFRASETPKTNLRFPLWNFSWLPAQEWPILRIFAKGVSEALKFLCEC
jgi:hypothetical protein